MKKKWMIATTNAEVAMGLKGLEHVPRDIPECGFAQCRGNAAVESAHYPEDFARHVWSALTPEAECTAPRKVAVARMASFRASSMPLWCCMLTRLVGLKTEEAPCDGARSAVALDKARARFPWYMGPLSVPRAQ